ncbi:MAG: glycoside hydrolase family 130 protein [Candidatus Bathyarchaeia archaeon]
MLGLTARGWREIVDRFDDNPILTRHNMPFPCNTVFNAGAVKMKDEYILLLRVEGLDGVSFLALARSRDGFHFEVEDEPVMTPSGEEPYKTYEALGVEDPRITEMEGWYYIFYTAYSVYGPRIGLARTRDFRDIERIGLVSQPVNKDAVLFPRKFNGRYVRFDRPMAPHGRAIWISYSSDLLYWGDSKVVMEARPGFWDSKKIGSGSPPIETDEGWLLIYHGVKETAAGGIYRLGTAMFDLDDPSRMLGRCTVPILSPLEYYERTGDVPNVVFTCGAVAEPDRGEVKIYYGAADTSICLGVARLEDLIRSCLHNP